jgi:hypothetical protein
MPVEAGDLLKKTNFAMFLNSGTESVPVWVRQGKTTDNTITHNPETVDYDYVENDSPSSEVKQYKPSLSYPLTMYKGDPAYEYIWSKAKTLAVGADAHTQVLVVFYADVQGAGYFAWLANAILVIDNINPVDATITVNVNFNGTVDNGIAVVTDNVPVYTSTVVTEFQMTVNVKLVASNVVGASVDIGGVRKLTDASGNAVFTLIDGETYTVGAWDDDSHEAADVFEADTGITTMNLVVA